MLNSSLGTNIPNRGVAFGKDNAGASQVGALSTSGCIVDERGDLITLEMIEVSLDPDNLDPGILFREGYTSRIISVLVDGQVQSIDLSDRGGTTLLSIYDNNSNFGYIYLLAPPQPAYVYEGAIFSIALTQSQDAGRALFLVAFRKRYTPEVVNLNPQQLGSHFLPDWATSMTLVRNNAPTSPMNVEQYGYTPHRIDNLVNYMQTLVIPITSVNRGTVVYVKNTSTTATLTYSVQYS